MNKNQKIEKLSDAICALSDSLEPSDIAQAVWIAANKIEENCARSDHSRNLRALIAHYARAKDDPASYL